MLSKKLLAVSLLSLSCGTTEQSHTCKKDPKPCFSLTYPKTDSFSTFEINDGYQFSSNWLNGNKYSLVISFFQKQNEFIKVENSKIKLLGTEFFIDGTLRDGSILLNPIENSKFVSTAHGIYSCPKKHCMDLPQSSEFCLFNDCINTWSIATGFDNPFEGYCNPLITQAVYLLQSQISTGHFTQSYATFSYSDDIKLPAMIEFSNNTRYFVGLPQFGLIYNQTQNANFPTVNLSIQRVGKTSVVISNNKLMVNGITIENVKTEITYIDPMKKLLYSIKLTYPESIKDNDFCDQ